MASSIKAKLFAAASLNAGLAALLATGSPAFFRWYDTQLPQGSVFPAVVVQGVSNPRDYAVTGKLPTSWQRIQLTVYGSGNDSENAETVVNAIEAFLDQFNAIGITGLLTYPNLIVGDRDAGVAQTQPMTYVRILDVRVFSNDLL